MMLGLTKMFWIPWCSIWRQVIILPLPGLACGLLGFEMGVLRTVFLGEAWPVALRAFSFLLVESFFLGEPLGFALEAPCPRLGRASLPISSRSPSDSTSEGRARKRASCSGSSSEGNSDGIPPQSSDSKRKLQLGLGPTNAPAKNDSKT